MFHGSRRLFYSILHFFDPESIDLLLRRCATTRHVKQIHAQLLLHHHSSAFLVARVVSTYSLLGLLHDALSAFHSFPHPRTTLLWNSILRASLFHTRPKEAILLYKQMLSGATAAAALPDGFTFPLIIRASSFLSDQIFGQSTHNHAIAMGYGYHLHVANELVAMYSSMGRMDLARKVFDRMPLRNVVSWNVLISGFAANFDCESAQDLFRQMESNGVEANPVTWTSLLSAHARCRRHGEVLRLFNEMRAHGSGTTPESVAVALSVCAYMNNGGLNKGKEIHCFVIKSGLEEFSFLRNSLICMYGKLSNRADAEKLFVQVARKDPVSWNALISTYAAAGLWEKAYELFVQMEKSEEVLPDLVSWSAVIVGYASCRMPEQSLELFRRMLGTGLMPNSVTLVTILSACAELSALQHGREIHAHTIRCSMDASQLVANGLVHMYMKSGSFRCGCIVFDKMVDRDLISWNSMIAGYGMHGVCDEALSAFSDMIREGIVPDGITFVAVLSACSHAGRVAEGRQVFDRMVNEYKISPKKEHYACLVDLLGRAGFLLEASSLVQSMPMKPNACVWGALLNSCRMHGNMAVADDVVMKVLGAELVAGSGNYMLLSNMYSASGKWEESARVRMFTKANGLKKNPAQSWIEVERKVHAFAAGSAFPPGREEVYGVLEVLNQQIEREEDYEPEFLFDGSEEFSG